MGVVSHADDLLLLRNSDAPFQPRAGNQSAACNSLAKTNEYFEVILANLTRATSPASYEVTSGQSPMFC